MNDQIEPKINPNTASLEELMQLPGIGAEMAQRIVDARPFEKAEDLQRVSGIGQQVLEELRLRLEFPESTPEVAAENDLPAESAPQPEIEMEETPPEEAEVETPAAAELPAVPETELPEPELSMEAEAQPESPETAPEVVPPALPAGEPAVEGEGALPGAPPEEPGPPAPPEAQPASPPAPVTRGQLFWVTGGCSLVTLVVAVVLTLLLLAGVNQWRLQYASPQQVNELFLRVSTLERANETLTGDVDGLRQRVDNLETLGNRVAEIEKSVQGVRSDLEGLGGQVNELNQRTGEIAEQVDSIRAENQRVRNFFQGLGELLGNLYPPEEVGK